MVAVRPEVVLTFGPTGISGHDDHITIHRAATAVFHRYRSTTVVAPRLYYVALPPEMAAQFAFDLHPSEMTLSVCLDIAAVKPLKLQGLRMYRSQRDAQELRCSLRPSNSVMNGLSSVSCTLSNGTTSTRIVA